MWSSIYLSRYRVVCTYQRLLCLENHATRVKPFEVLHVGRPAVLQSMENVLANSIQNGLVHPSTARIAPDTVITTYKG